jgi:hypothetical protein
MLGKKSSASVVSLNSRDGVTSKEQIIVATKTEFFDGMLTFGWLAERRGAVAKTAELKVVEVNDSLRDWLRENSLQDVVDEINDDGLGIKQFLMRIVDDEHNRVGEIVEGNLRFITEKVEELNYEKVASNRKEKILKDERLEDKQEDQYTVQRTIRFVNDNKDRSLLVGVLAGVRVVAPGAIRLRSDNDRNRVDLVSVCQSVREGAGWRVVRYQGLLQQAWLRVKSTIREGTKAGTVGLVSRNMSHNIGSHALFYLEVDEKDLEKKTFFRYMRERMELLAGFATSMPLSSGPGQLSELVEGFKKNKALLTRIARSERVDNIQIEFDKKNNDRAVALPGGVLAAQALYSIFENNIRDSAKHGRTKNSDQTGMVLRIRAQDPHDSRFPEFKEDFIELIVSDNRNNYDTAGPRLKDSLAKLRIVDVTGRLEPGDWGVKERFISAAILRGRRLEDIEVQLQPDPTQQEIKYFIGEYAPLGEPKILDVINVDGNLGWVFYLLKPKDILLIGGDFRSSDPNLIPNLEEKFRGAINVDSFQWLLDNVEKPSKIRHRFLVVFVENQTELDKLEALRDKLPYRVIVCPRSELELADSSRFASVSEEDLDVTNLSLDRLYQLWVNWLLDYPPKSLLEKTRRLMRRLMGGKKGPGMPEIIFRDAGFKALTLDESAATFRWTLDDDKNYQTDRPVLLYDRHGSCMRNRSRGEEGVPKELEWNESGQRFSANVTHYESYDQGDAMYSLAFAAVSQINRKSLDDPLKVSALGFSFLEAGLTKILIVDERLDPTSEKKMSYHPEVPKWECSLKEIFKWKGIDIKGEEYARDKIPGPELLVRWVNQKNYDFLVLHKGIVDKLIKLGNRDYLSDPKVLMNDLFGRLREHVRHIVIHSGRMAASELPEGVKFMSLSNVDTWLKDNRPKIQIVEDLYLLRRP